MLRMNQRAMFPFCDYIRYARLLAIIEGSLAMLSSIYLSDLSFKIFHLIFQIAHFAAFSECD